MPACPECHGDHAIGVAACPPRDGAAPLAEKSDPLISTTIAGRFLVRARIGLGGMGIVYRATHTVIGREVAIKVLHERHVERREVAARLVNEARLASSIHNEHIIEIFDSGETADGRTFLVMELLDGEPLSQVIRREGALPERRAVGIVLQAALALGAAHERGVIHRDVKPENLFILCRDGADFVKVLDFGISKAIPGAGLPAEEAVRLTHTGMVLGTPLYMSPEQARGEDKIDPRIDVYALGVILYECLTGETPFRGGNYLHVIQDVLSREPARPREVRPDLAISAAVERVAARAMARSREARYPTMAALAADLRRVLSGEPIEEAAPAPVAARPRRRRLVAAIGGVAALATAIAMMTAGSGGGGAARRDAPAGTPDIAVVAMPAAGAAPAAADSDGGAAPSALPAAVTLKVTSAPAGAEIWSGARRLGVTPRDVSLPRSDHPVVLTFRRSGFAETNVEVVPAVDGEAVDVELAPYKQKAPPRRRPGAAAEERLPMERWPGERRR